VHVPLAWGYRVAENPTTVVKRAIAFEDFDVPLLNPTEFLLEKVENGEIPPSSDAEGSGAMANIDPQAPRELQEVLDDLEWMRLEVNSVNPERAITTRRVTPELADMGAGQDGRA
jgi:hypothetical protein